MPTRLSGQIEHVTFTNQETGFTIAKVKVPGRYEPVTVVGTLLAPTPGEVLEMVGEWTSHPRFGDQFKVEQFTTKVPGTIHGIVKYLGSGMIKGLGPVMAERIVARFGKRTLDIIESDVGRLAEVPGVGAKRIGMIATAWEAQREIRDVMVFLQSHGVGTGFAAKIFRQYGSRSVAVVRENPYRLATDIAGVGFVMADRIAGNIGIPPTAPMRVEAGILFVLQQISEEGHTYHPRGLLVDRCREILKVEPEAIELALMAIQAERRVVIEPEAAGALEAAAGDAVFLTTYHVCETTIARRLKALLEVPRGLRRLDAGRAVAWVQAHLDLRLSETQAQALQAALDHKVMVITGGPGTGKTTVVNAVLKIFERASARVLLAAPTGRAAKRLNEATGREARTIHRLLEYSPQRGGFQRTDEEPLECDLLVVDETSMVDTVLMHHLIAAVPLAAACILVGDVNQLPSVGPGNVLGDIIDSGAVPVVRLTEIFRQASRSRIVVNAHRINQGLMPEAAPDTDDGPQDFYFIEQEDPERVLATILELARNRIPRRFGLDPVDGIQVMTPMHKGVVGAANLNRRLQEVLNPGEGGVARGDRLFRVGDKVMQVRNNYDKDVFNGDIGRIASISNEERALTVRIDGREVSYDFGELDELAHAFAVSVHKAQGSEYPAVVFPVLTQHYILLQRNLIYTALTRARRLAVIVGTRRALAIGIKNTGTERRYTRLADRLKLISLI
ncbi:MAG: helicase RecD/TraA family protein [candidate division NC10 bacterium]|nr:helicase RecD/TraA family protein [candidate division NC10 bacterium]